MNCQMEIDAQLKRHGIVVIFYMYSFSVIVSTCRIFSHMVSSTVTANVYNRCLHLVLKHASSNPNKWILCSKYRVNLQRVNDIDLRE